MIFFGGALAHGRIGSRAGWSTLLVGLRTIGGAMHDCCGGGTGRYGAVLGTYMYINYRDQGKKGELSRRWRT